MFLAVAGPEADGCLRIISGVGHQPYGQPVGFDFGSLDPFGTLAELAEKTAVHVLRVKPVTVVEQIVRKFMRDHGGKFIVVQKIFRHLRSDRHQFSVSRGAPILAYRNLEAARTSLF